MVDLKEFLKDIKILYVEDDQLAREKLKVILSKISNHVEIAQNGVEGFLMFQENHQKNDAYDIIITDLNMPKMGGIEMVSKIKELDLEVPIVVTTARNEKDTFLELIELNITSFLIKPIDFSKLFESIKKIAKKIYYQKQFYAKQKELEAYTNIIESVAVISKTDTKGIITYVDEAFCEVTGYTKEELIGQNHNIVRHPDNQSIIYEQLWNTIQKGETWEGKVKNIDKNGNPWYAKSTVMPIYDKKNEKIIEYISIRFIVTQEYEEKRELNTKLIKSTIDHKKELSSFQKKNEEYQNTIKIQNENIILLNEHIIKYKEQIKQLKSQINMYEKGSSSNKNDKMELLKRKNEELTSRNKVIEKLNTLNNQNNDTIETLNRSLNSKDSKIEKLKENIKAYKIEIGQLKQNIKDNEKKKKSLF